MTVAPVPIGTKTSLSASSVEATQLSRGSDVFLVSAICVLGALLRFYHISYLSLWGDEAFSRFYYESGLHFMWTEGLRSESSPPLYYMALGAWIDLFGSSEAALRSLSAVASTVAIVLVYQLGKELFDRKSGLLAAALFALSATEIYYAQEARCYALLLIPVLAMMIASGRYLRGVGGYASFATYILAATVALYAHTTMFLLVAACGLAVFAFLLTASGSPWDRRVISWTGAHFCIGALALPVFIGMTNPVQWQQLAWIPTVDFHQIGAVFSNTVAGTLTPGHFPGGIIAVTVACALAISIWRDRPSWRAAVIVLAIPGLYTALVVFVSLTVQPILLSRIFNWVVIPLCLVEARALMARGWLRPITIWVILGTTAVGLYYQLAINPNAKEPWREAIQRASSDLLQADIVVLGPDTDPAALMYYAPKLTRVAILWSEAAAPSELGIMPRLLDVAGVTLHQVARQINDTSSRTVLIGKGGNERVLSELFQLARPPDERADFPCRGGDGKPTDYPCGIAMLVWRPRSQ